MTPRILAFGLLAVALASGCFYGAKACEIFDVSSSSKSKAWKFHQFWFNLLGCLLGWAALGLMLHQHQWFMSAEHHPVTLSDGVLLTTGFIGMTGPLPLTIMGVIGTLSHVAMKLIGLADR